MSTAPIAGPDYFSIAAIHRANDGWVTFHAKVQTDQGEEEFRNLFSVSAETLTQWFPEFREELERDSFFSLNAFYRHPKARSVERNYTPRRSNNLRWLNCCWVDCDCYNVGLSWAEAVGAIQHLQDAGEIPPASFLIRSGRGVWLLWLVRGEDDHSQGERAHSRQVRLWAKLQQALTDKLRPLGADSAARDATRIARVPGSINSKSGVRVEFLMQGFGGRGACYTLGELAGLVGIEPGAVVDPPAIRARNVKQPTLPLDGIEAACRKRKRRDPGQPLTATQERAMRGWQARAARRLDNFTTLLDLRGGTFNEGCRHNVTLLYASFVTAAGYHGEERVDMVEAFNEKHLRPPLSASDIRAKCSQGGRFIRIKNVTISAWLAITPEEAALLVGWPAAGAPVPGPVISSRREQAQRRRALIREFCKRYPRTPSLRTLVSLLADAGVETCLRTVQSDLVALRISNPRGRGTMKQLPLSFGG